jgi:hypothetical protein
MMSGEQRADFYQGWIIEVASEAGGFRSTCYSMSRKRLHCKQTYSQDSQAIHAAKQLINQYSACSQLSLAFRGFYEEGKLNLEEWRSLNRSLFGE